MDTNGDNEELLEELHKEKIKEYRPVIACVAIVIALGIVGNIMTLIFYGFRNNNKSSTMVFSLSLVAIDLTTCVVLSDEIIELYYNITLRFGCHVMYFINHWLVSSSVWISFIIFIDRYRKICNPFASQFTMASAKIAIAVVIGVALLHAIPNSLIRDIVRVNVTNSLGNTVQGYYCTQSEDPGLHTTITALHVLDVSLVCVACITCLVSNGLVLHKVRNFSFTDNSSMFYHNDIDDVSYCKTTDETGEDKANSLKADRTNTLDNKAGGTNTMENNQNNTASTSTSINTENVFPSNQETQTREKIRRLFFIEYVHESLTLKRERHSSNIKDTWICMMVAYTIAYTIGYIVSFIPYFIVNLAVIPNKERSKELSAGIQLAVRSFILNSTINPIIINVCKPSFRRYVKDSFCRCFRK